jgi:hypothetical protein
VDYLSLVLLTSSLVSALGFLASKPWRRKIVSDGWVVRAVEDMTAGKSIAWALMRSEAPSSLEEARRLYMGYRPSKPLRGPGHPLLEAAKLARLTSRSGAPAAVREVKLALDSFEAKERRLAAMEAAARLRGTVLAGALCFLLPIVGKLSPVLGVLGGAGYRGTASYVMPPWATAAMALISSYFLALSLDPDNGGRLGRFALFSLILFVSISLSSTISIFGST